jgi:hypothetical protein
LGADGGDLVALLRPLALGVGLDEPVPLEALQRRVDLADVERPDLASLSRARSAWGTLMKGF